MLWPDCKGHIRRIVSPSVRWPAAAAADEVCVTG